MTKENSDQHAPPDDAPDERDAPGGAEMFPVVGVGASAGGLEAFTHLLRALPADTGMAFVLVQHLAPAHPSALAEILSRTTAMPVVEVQDEPAVEPNHVYVIPPGRSIVISEGVLHLRPREGRGAPHPIDQFFRALAEDRRHQAIGVVLSGTATDGTLGLEAIKAEGGITFAQDATAQHEGMPHSAIASGIVDFVLPPDAIARELARIAEHLAAVPDADGRAPREEPSFAKVLDRLRRTTGVDFADYKFNTLYRRITRRMVLERMDSLADYVRVLDERPAELAALYQDILISVTSFFRDPAAFEALKAKVFPRLLASRSGTEPVRVWTLGCSTGEEAYSLAMAFAEVADTAERPVPLQLFATDLNEAGIAAARAGVYPKTIAEGVSPERLRRFFSEVNGSYQISKSIRDACVFSRHNVLADPPFSRIDLISCRNLLIYLEPVLQQRIVPTLHYALRPKGFLWLGGSETIGGHRDLFEAEDAKHKIFAKKPGPSPHPSQFPLPGAGAPRAAFQPIAARPSSEAELYREADRILVSKFAPPGVLVTADLDILQFRGDTGAYLAPSPGRASLNLLKMLREGLLVAVRATVERARTEHVTVREEGVRVRSNGGSREVAVEVIPVKGSGHEPGGFLILFEDAADPWPRETWRDESRERASSAAVAPPAADADTARLERELEATRAYLQAVIEQQEAANEELQSANEEVQSANEELQSINEELETSKEEIQSSNEELVTVNDELNNRNLELGRLNDDLVNLFASVQIAIVMVGPDLRVRRFTPEAEKLLNLIPTDIGRPLADIKLNLEGLPDLEPLLAEVLDTVSTRERDVRGKHGRWYSLRLRPYKTLDNRIDGVVVTLVDVDALKRAHEYTESIVATVREPLLVLDADLRVRTASRSFYAHFGASPAETDGRLVYELGNREWDIPALRRALEEILPEDHQFDDFEVVHDFERLGRRTMMLNARRLLQIDGRAPAILLAIEDVTDRKQAAEAMAYMATIVTSTDDAIVGKDLQGIIRSWNPGAERLFGYTAEDAIGQPTTMLMPPERLDEEPRILERIRRGEAIDHYETVRVRKDGRLIDVSLSIAPLRDAAGRVVGAAKIARDITERKRAEALLHQSATDLSEADQRKDEFLAMLAHELRNPLAPIQNALHLIRQTAADEETIRSATAIMERQVRQMVRLVDDLLDVNRIGRGKITLRREPIDVVSVVRDAVDATRPAIESKGQPLDVVLPSEPVYVDGDPARLLQVIGNLLNNASKFTDEGGRISLTAERDGEEAVLRVRDTGIGIASDQLPRVFDIFVQVDTSLDRSAGGLGMGLTLVKDLVEMHGGTVEAHSDGLGCGSEFAVRLPALVSTPEPPAPEPSVSVPPRARARRILIVDDNPDSAESMALLLQHAGHETHTAADGLEAVDAAAALRPDVVLLDIGLPTLDGYEACRKIREHAWGKSMVVVALTGWSTAEDRQRSSDAGFNAHLVKPVNYAALAKLLAEVPDAESES